MRASSQPTELWAPERFSAREALGAQYVRFLSNPLFKGGSFVELESRGLRADFLVGSSQVDAGVEPDAAQ